MKPSARRGIQQPKGYSMSATTPDALIRQLNWRYATKRFDPARRIPDADWKTLEQVLLLSPSSYGLQPWRFIIVSDAATKARLAPISWNQPQVTECSHLVVFASRTQPTLHDVDRLIARVAEVRGASRESLQGYRDAMAGLVTDPPPGVDLGAWAARQTYLALGVFLSAAAMLGIDACPMEGINAPEYDKFFNLAAEGYSARCIATAGYRSPDDKYAALAKVRFAPEQVIRQISG